jgi:hypothetical protein
MKTNVYLWKHLADFFSEWETSQTKVVDKTKNTDFMPDIIFWGGHFVVYEIMWKNMVQPDRPQIKI